MRVPTQISMRERTQPIRQPQTLCAHKHAVRVAQQQSAHNTNRFLDSTRALQPVRAGASPIARTLNLGSHFVRRRGGRQPRCVSLAAPGRARVCARARALKFCRCCTRRARQNELSDVHVSLCPLAVSPAGPQSVVAYRTHARTHEAYLHAHCSIVALLLQPH